MKHNDQIAAFLTNIVALSEKASSAFPTEFPQGIGK